MPTDLSFDPLIDNQPDIGTPKRPSRTILAGVDLPFRAVFVLVCQSMAAAAVFGLVLGMLGTILSFFATVFLVGAARADPGLPSIPGGPGRPAMDQPALAPVPEAADGTLGREYCVVWSPGGRDPANTDCPTRPDKIGADFLTVLNHEGGDGWRLVQVITQGPALTAFMERPKP